MIKILKNQSGVALMMVIGVIAILTYLLADFTFETKINKLKSYNYQDKTQARLTAESGLNLALTNLRIYQEGRNKLETQASAKSAFPPDKLEAVLTQPFIYPIPMSKNANIIQKTALADFEKENLLKGELTVTYAKVVGFLNPNSLRMPEKIVGTNQYEDQAAEDESTQEDTSSSDGQKSIKTQAVNIINDKLVETLERIILDESEINENFHQKFSNTDPQELVNEIKFYVNSPDNVQGQNFVDAKAKFEQKKITPKHARMNSIDELNLLPSWDEDLVGLIRDRLSVHEVSMISLNEITKEDLKILFPTITDIQIEEFFKHRDGDPDKNIEPKKFKSVDQFKDLVTGPLQIISDGDFDDRMKELKNAGLSLDVAGKLFKVTSQGKFNNATVTLVAFIDLPIVPVVEETKKKKQQSSSDDEETPRETSSDSEKKEEETKPIELMTPRIIELRLQ